MPVTSNSSARYAKSTPSPLKAPTACRHAVSGTISLPFWGSISPFPHGTSPLSVTREYLALEGGPPRFRPRFTGAVLLRNVSRKTMRFRLRDCYPLWCPCSTDLRLANDFVTPAQECSPGRPVLQPRLRNACTLARSRFRLVRFRSPLLAESRLISFPRGTEMFQFPRLPPRPYVFRPG